MLVELLMSTYLRDRPIITANPFSDEEYDKRAAKVAEMLLRHSWEELYFDEIMADIVRWLGVAGNCFARVEWDGFKGKQTAKIDQNGRKTGDMIPTGRPVVDIISPTSIAIEPGAIKFEKAIWYVVADIVDAYRLGERFNTKIEPEVDDEAMMTFRPQPLDGRNYDGKERVTLYTQYERPTKNHPTGQIVYVANKQVLHKQPLPVDGYGVPQVEMVHFRAIELPGELWATSPVSQGIPSQMELNRTKSQMMEARNYATRPMLVATTSALPREPEFKPGGIMKWDPIAAQGNEPHFLNPPTFPQWVIQTIGMNENDIMDLTSRHESSQGSSGGGVNSFKQASFYKSSDDSRLLPSIRSFQVGLTKLGKYILSNYERNLKGNQILYIVGKNKRHEVFRFESNEVSSLCNITYDIASKLPWSKENMRQQVMWMRQQGIIDQERFEEMVEMPTSQKMYDLQQRERENARQENDILANQFFPPFPTDNDTVHIQEHKQAINNSEKRTELIQEMISQQQRFAQIKMEDAQMGNPPREFPEYPMSITNLLRHIEMHQQRMPKPAAPPPAAKVNLSVDKLLENPVVLQNPQLQQEIAAAASDLVHDAASFDSAPDDEGNPEDARAPQAGGSPPGGMSGELYSAAMGDQKKGS